MATQVIKLNYYGIKILKSPYISPYINMLKISVTDSLVEVFHDLGTRVLLSKDLVILVALMT